MDSNPFIIRCKCNSAILEFINFSSPMPNNTCSTYRQQLQTQTLQPQPFYFNKNSHYFIEITCKATVHVRLNVLYTFSQLIQLAYAFMCSSISRQLNLIYFYYLIQAIEHKRNPLQSEETQVAK